MNTKIQAAILGAFGAFIISATSGCGLLFLGTEEIDLWGAKAKFASGFTARAGMNSIDQVDDRQGVNTRSQNREKY